MKKIALSAAVALTLTGCASVITGTDQTMNFNSSPDGAVVSVAGQVVGKTPVSVQIDKGSNQIVSFQKDGYETFTTQLTTGLNPWFWGNFIIGGLPGSTTDAASGAINEFSPDQYFITLTPETSFGISGSNTRKIKEIVVGSGSSVREQLSQGGGEYVNAILEIIGSDEATRVQTIETLAALAGRNSNDLVLANAIIEVYEVK